jgi:hypothetical protein
MSFDVGVTNKSKNSESNIKSMLFLGVLWFSLFVAFMFLVILLVTTFMNGIGRYDLRLFTEYNNTTPRDAGARAAILGSVFVVSITALLAIPIGIASAIYLEEFADKNAFATIPAVVMFDTTLPPTLIEILPLADGIVTFELPFLMDVAVILPTKLLAVTSPMNVPVLPPILIKSFKFDTLYPLYFIY